MADAGVPLPNSGGSPARSSAPPGDSSASPSLEEEVRIEQVLLLSHHIWTIVIGNLVNGLLVVAFFWDMGSRPLLVGWLLLVAAFSISRLNAMRRHRGKPRPTAIAKTAIDRAIVISAGAGLLWGGFAALIFPPDSIQHQMLLCFVVGGMAAGALAGLASIPAAANSYIACALAPVIARLALGGDALHWFMVMMLSFYGLVLMAFARSSYGTFLESVRLRVANAGMRRVAEANERRLSVILDTTHEAFISMDRAGRIIAWNAEAERIFGWSRDEAMGRLLADTIVPAPYRDSHTGGLARHAATGLSTILNQRLELSAVRRDGSEFPIELTISPLGAGDTLTYHAFMHDITDRKRDEAALIEARAEADQANEAKSVFLASMSHEIRTPMSGVIGFTDLLLDSTLTDEQRVQVNLLRDSGKSLLALINDILDFSKIEAGKLELEHIPVSPAAVMDGAGSIMKSQIGAKGLTLALEHGPELPGWISGDPIRLRQILINLLGNALKFTDRGGVTLRCLAPAPGQLRFEVEDTGIGIDADRLHLLFQDFSQIDRSTTRRYGGTGLGLAICKRLAAAMGGAIGVASVAGQGSLFWFTIARVDTDPPGELSAGFVPRIHARSVSVLVADDQPINQLIIQGLLRAEGHLVTLVKNGVEALAAVQDGAFDVVLMDMEMPEMDGISATRAIRNLPGPIRNVPIVAVTANAMLDDAAACREAGMNDYLSKPIDRAALAAKVARWTQAGA